MDWQNNAKESPLSIAIELPNQKVFAQLLHAHGGQLTSALYNNMLKMIQIQLAWHDVWPRPGFEELKRIQSMVKAFGSPSNGKYNHLALAEMLPESTQ